MKLDKNYLRGRQSLPLEAKIAFSQQRIREFYTQLEGEVYVAFSGGKDSTVLLSIVRDLYPSVTAVFCNTGQDFPEVRKFVNSTPNVIKLKPLMPFKQVVEEYGWPVLSKKTASALSYLQKMGKEGPKVDKYKELVAERWWFLKDAPFKISDHCCNLLKKRPSAMYEKATGKKPILGMLASDSDQRELHYMKRGGCNTFNRNCSSWPLAIWTERDIWEYLKKYNVPYSNIYDKGYYRTGCMTCLFGIHLDCGFKGENRIQTLKRTHPKIWEYYINKTALKEVMDYMNFPIEPF